MIDTTSQRFKDLRKQARAGLNCEIGLIELMVKTRVDKGITVEDLAFGCGVTPHYVETVEKRAVSPPLSFVRRYLSYVGVLEPLIGDSPSATVNITIRIGIDHSDWEVTHD
jgi:transcriptional regulator with XRE-family HTH domain